MNIRKKITLLYNGSIHTMEPEAAVADAILISGNLILACGRLSDINLPDERVEKINLEGRSVYPSFTDCHTHIAAVALYQERLNLDDCRSVAEAKERITQYTGRVNPGEWIVGGGWNANTWPSGLPDRKDIDPLTPKNPVALYNKDGHTQWLNSQALKKCGFTQSVADPEGGRLARDDQGQLTGLVYEKACEIVDRISDVTSYQQLSRCMDRLYPELYRVGITGAHSCEGLDKFHLFRELRDKGDLKIRISMQPPAADVEELLKEKEGSGQGDDWLRMGGLKYFMDGSLGSRTAEMFDEFTGTGQKGIGVLDESELYEKISYAARSGLSATVHAIGDKANHKALNAFERLKNQLPDTKLRHRIEHAQILLPSDIKRFASLDVIASMQPMHIADDVRIADKYLGDRTKYTYPIGSLRSSGCHLIFGSDMPVADPDPLKGILAAVSRRYQLDAAQPRWQEQECITPEQAVVAYTRDAAFASYEENRKGTLTVNKLADLVVINKDILKSDEDDLRSAKVDMTMLDGKIVYRTF